MSDSRFAGLLQDLSGRTDKVLAALVVAQLAAAAEGVGIALAATGGTLAPAVARARMVEVEHDGDARRADLVTRLRDSITSPIDREDLFRLSRSVDDILDTLRDFVRELDLFDMVFDVAPSNTCTPLLHALDASVDELVAAVALLPTDPRAAAARALQAKKPGVRAPYQLAVAALLAEPLTARSLKTTLLLGRLDCAGTHLAAAADALADGVVKRFQ